MIRVTMPQAGQSMEEGTILGWRKDEGERVAKGEILLEIETDKASIEIEAVGDGVLRQVLCPQGVTVPVLAPIAIIAEPDEDISEALSQARAELSGLLGEKLPPLSAAPASPPGMESSQPQGEKAPPAPAVPGRVRASPVARRAARERDLDLHRLVPGSGPGGRVILADVMRASEKTAVSSAPAAATRRALTGMRRAIARSLLFSKQNIPHFYMRLTIDAGPLLAFYREAKSQYPCTLSDILVLGCARVITEFPAFRSRIEGGDLVEFPGASIGLAVGMEEGLRVPVLVGADGMNLRTIAAETGRIVAAAQQGKVEAMGQGVFTISNLGMFGIEEFSAIINPPESAILAVGAIRETVLVKDGALRAARVMTMTLSADHRLIDGLIAARFMGRLRELLESREALSQAARSGA